MLEVRNLSVAYGGLRALSDVSLSVGERQFVTLVGPNGAGKSTLFKTISGVVAPVSGAISFAGQDLLARRPSDRAHLGIAPLYGFDTALEERTRTVRTCQEPLADLEERACIGAAVHEILHFSSSRDPRARSRPRRS